MKKLLFTTANKSILLLLLLFISSGCERLFMENQEEATPKQIFEQAWTYADENYSFFKFKGIDWDSVKTAFEPRISNGMDDEALFNVIADMLYLLRDGHVNLRSDFNRSRNWTWYLNSPSNFDADLLERNYFKEQQQFVGPFTVYDFGDVGYAYYGSFTDNVSESDMDYLIKKFGSYKGLIIDVRDNGGGSLANVYNIANRFVNEQTIVANEQFKNGPKHEDFTDKRSLKLEPIADNSLWYQAKVVVLTNRKTYSAGSFFTQCMRELPQVTVIGDTTGGGGGIPVFTDLNNGWIIRVSGSRTFALDGLNIEDGTPPDVRVDLDLTTDKDEILEAALSFLRL